MTDGDILVSNLAKKLVSFDNRETFVEPTLNISENFSQITDIKFV